MSLTCDPSEDEIGTVLRPMDFLRPGALMTRTELFEDPQDQPEDPEWITKEERQAKMLTKMHRGLLQRLQVLWKEFNSQSNI